MSGPEGTPNGVDRLERIESVARTTREAWGTNAYADDVLALVEIAKAAREWAEAETSENYSNALRELRKTVAKLDSGRRADRCTCPMKQIVRGEPGMLRATAQECPVHGTALARLDSGGHYDFG